jgi:aerobic-type carbon monoxide dehydrogenase small subunit (CoxS/CutS family)
MSQLVNVSINGTPLEVPVGTSVVAAVLMQGDFGFNLSPGGFGRGPLCGMGVCGDCRVFVDGRLHLRACLLPCQAGMAIRVHRPIPDLHPTPTTPPPPSSTTRVP